MDPSLFAPLGVTGVVCVVLSAWIVDLRKQNEALRQELRESNRQMVAEVVPLATRMLDALKEAGDLVRGIVAKDHGT